MAAAAQLTTVAVCAFVCMRLIKFRTHWTRCVCRVLCANGLIILLHDINYHSKLFVKDLHIRLELHPSWVPKWKFNLVLNFGRYYISCVPGFLRYHTSQVWIFYGTTLIGFQIFCIEHYTLWTDTHIIPH